MIWNWQQTDWPHFTYSKQNLDNIEATFLREAGYLRGTLAHVPDDERTRLTVDSLSEEALKTSEIEGEYLNRDSLQSSIRRNFGLETSNAKVKPAEQGISDLMTGLYQDYDKPLSHKVLFAWHALLMKGNKEIKTIGAYRNHPDPMQVVSGALHKPKVHFEAPPSSNVSAEMERFIHWFNDTSPNGNNPLSAILRAAIGHLYFECIHPFEDGNGRIGRALVIKSLCQNFNQPMLLALSYIIQKNSKHYYNALEENNKKIEITSWIIYFAKTILEAQTYTQRLVDYIVEKGKLYRRVKNLINERQLKVLDRMFLDGPDSFPFGMNADKYIRITGTSRATATRDLQDMVEKGIYIKKGELKASRYLFKFSQDSALFDNQSQ